MAAPGLRAKASQSTPEKCLDKPITSVMRDRIFPGQERKLRLCSMTSWQWGGGKARESDIAVIYSKVRY